MVYLIRITNFMAAYDLKSCCKFQKVPVLTVNARNILKVATNSLKVFILFLLKSITIKQDRCSRNNLLIDLDTKRLPSLKQECNAILFYKILRPKVWSVK